jgi:hypothetical protein
MFKKDTIWLGLIPALILPVLVGFGYYMYLFGWKSFSELMEVTMNKSMLSPVLSLGCVLNLGLFFLFLKFDKILASRGVISATFVYAGIILYLKAFA